MTPAEVADRVEQMLRELSPRDRVKARLIIKRRLDHPEAGEGATAGYVAPPRSTGDNAANREPHLCLVCNWPKWAHDIDGLLPDCDGFIYPFSY